LTAFAHRVYIQSMSNARLAGLALLTTAACAIHEDGSSSTAPLARGAPRRPVLTSQASGTTNRLQAVSPASSRVVWASGLGGTYTVTTDGGKTWRAAVVPGAETLQFRDVEAVSDRVAYLLSAGVGPDSRIYKTVDGGAHWELLFQNQEPNGFYDCFAFFTSRRGLVMGDSVNGQLPVLQTRDGQTWTNIGAQLPVAQAGESAFAASGTCIATLGLRRAWIATGGAEHARVLATTDAGRSWTAHDTPIAQGTQTSGGFSIAFRDARHGILAAGELTTSDEQPLKNFARSRDGGETWALTAPAPFAGAVFGTAYALGSAGRLHGARDDIDDDTALEAELTDDRHRADVSVVATGPAGAAWSADEGDSWVALDGVTNYWSVAFADERTGWLVGTDGRILRIDL
jgi:photosystem II stability/assembly factor-like uncharacterized protein